MAEDDSEKELQDPWTRRGARDEESDEKVWGSVQAQSVVLEQGVCACGVCRRRPDGTWRIQYLTWLGAQN